MKKPSIQVCTKAFDTLAQILSCSDFVDHEIRGVKFDALKMVNVRFKEMLANEELAVAEFGDNGEHTYKSIAELIKRTLALCLHALRSEHERPR